MNKRTKTILVIVGIILIIILLILFFILKNSNEKYPDEPIMQTSLYYTKQEINLELEDLKAQEYPLIGLSNSVLLDKVAEFVESIDPKMVQTINEEGSYYKWEDGDSFVIYKLNKGTVEFKFKNGIIWNEAEITDYSFTSFTKKYFGKDYDYKISLKELNTDGAMIYYANRSFLEQLIETAENKKQTDYLSVKDGKIIYGKILLTEFFDTELYLPTLDRQGLLKYINTNKYPKEIYPNYSTLQSTVLKELDYLSEDFEEMIDTLGNCKGDNVSVVYLYKNFDQEYLMPVYKMDVMCEVSYEDEKYTVPAIAYTNAVEPDYVLVSE
ncbi:MAG: hypothetical protein PHE21_01740 [Candidatus Dojkabacteria bacterium]|nr:hypothetical protein [Candidatus Dojkabacteria bacterium]